MTTIQDLEFEVTTLTLRLSAHPLYRQIRTKKDLHIFMEAHVFAVWDFMSLLKRLQRDITCVDVPWRPSHYPKELVRFINEIVLGEESDKDVVGHATDHFSLYLAAMEEIGANLNPIGKFLLTIDEKLLPKEVVNFVKFNLRIAKKAELHKVAAVFFYGREKLIPEMFSGIINDIWTNHSLSAFPKLRYYLRRHIDIDGSEHSILAERCLSILCENRIDLRLQALEAGVEALKMRIELWDLTLRKIDESRSQEVIF